MIVLAHLRRSHTFRSTLVKLPGLRHDLPASRNKLRSFDSKLRNTDSSLCIRFMDKVCGLARHLDVRQRPGKSCQIALIRFPTLEFRFRCACQ